MKVLELVRDYPDLNGNKSLMYAHTRNVFYKTHGIDVTVLNFMTQKSYIIDDIKVIDINSYNGKEHYDILICHAANLKNHYRFLSKYRKNFKMVVFFFHGHEVLKRSKIYPDNYAYVKKDNLLRVLMNNTYDDIKLFLWRKYFKKNMPSSYLVFVSNWMHQQFLKWTKIKEESILGKYSITYNCVNSVFEKNSYDFNSEKKYDFITIREFLDGSKYAVDLVNNLAKQNPKMSFLVIGKGSFFEYNEKADNLYWIDKQLTHNEIINYLNGAKCALMPTRADAQGVMMCEMATFGIPLITSNLDVCYEALRDFRNVFFMDNNETIKLEPVLKDMMSNFDAHKVKVFFNDNTSMKEVELLESIHNLINSDLESR